MNDIIYQRIEKNPHFKELVDKRQHFAMLLTLIMLVLYYGFILLIAFAPGWLGFGHAFAAQDESDQVQKYILPIEHNFADISMYAKFSCALSLSEVARSSFL